MEKRDMFRKSNRNGHPVSQRDYNLVLRQEKIPQEACDVQSQYSTLFPLSSHPSNPPIRFSPIVPSLDGRRSRQTFSPHLPSLRPANRPHPQLDPTSRKRSQPGLDPSLAPIPVSPDFLSSLPANRHRRPGIVSPLPAGNPALRPIRPRTLQSHDRQRRCHPCRPKLENRQGYRQVLPGTTIRPTLLRGPAHPGRRRDLHPQRVPFSNLKF